MEFLTIFHVPTLILVLGFPFSQLLSCLPCSLSGWFSHWLNPTRTRRQESLVDAETSLLIHKGRIEKVVSGSVEAKRNIQLGYKGINFSKLNCQDLGPYVNW